MGQGEGRKNGEGGQEGIESEAGKSGRTWEKKISRKRRQREIWLEWEYSAE